MCRPLNEIASSHLARRCFIGNLYKQVKDPNLVGVLSGHKEGSKAQLYADVDKFIKSGKYELLMEAKDSGQTVKMYTVGNDVTVNSFVMIAKDGGETTFICIDGNMTRSDLEKLLAEQMK